MRHIWHWSVKGLGSSLRENDTKFKPRSEYTKASPGQYLL